MAPDREHMLAALSLARRGLGSVWPNPAVGAVLVKDGRVIGRGFTQPTGRPHAEAVALEQAGAEARGATAYVTLEPCCHPGRGPACADLLVAAGVLRVVAAAPDPDPRVDGGGIARLQNAGVEVELGLLSEEADRINQGFRSRVLLGRPMVTLKLATTLDGRIATRTGESQWITGAEARRAVHALRARFDAIMVGIGTVLADNPDLTCRVAGMKPVPMVRVVADSHLRTPHLSRLAVTAPEHPVWLLHRADADLERAQSLEMEGVSLLPVPAGPVGIAVDEALRVLAAKGITRLLVEGGGKLAASLIRADLVDRIVWFHAPAIMGSDGWPAVQEFGVAELAALRRFKLLDVRRYGPDLCSEYER